MSGSHTASRGQRRKCKLSFPNLTYYIRKYEKKKGKRKYVTGWERKEKKKLKLTILGENFRIYFTNQNSLNSEM